MFLFNLSLTFSIYSVLCILLIILVLIQIVVIFVVVEDARGISSTTLYIILAVAAGIILILLGVVLIVVFRRRDGGVANSPDRSKKGYVKGNVKGDLNHLITNINSINNLMIKTNLTLNGCSFGFLSHFAVGKLGKADNPPDLWIHHDQMEMKGIDKSQRSNSVNTVSPVMRRSQDLDSLDGMPSSSTAGRPSNPTDSLDRRVGYITTYAGSYLIDLTFKMNQYNYFNK